MLEGGSKSPLSVLVDHALPATRDVQPQVLALASSLDHNAQVSQASLNPDSNLPGTGHDQGLGGQIHAPAAQAQADPKNCFHHQVLGPPITAIAAKRKVIHPLSWNDSRNTTVKGLQNAVEPQASHVVAIPLTSSSSSAREELKGVDPTLPKEDPATHVKGQRHAEALSRVAPLSGLSKQKRIFQHVIVGGNIK